MRKLVFCLFICLCGDVSAQDTINNWSIGALAGVERCGRLLTDAGGNEDVVESWDALEQNVWRITGGLRAERHLTKRFSVFTGLSYVDRGYRIDTLVDAGLNSLDFHFRSIDLPLGLIYTGKLSGKNSLYAATAVSAGYNFKDVVYYQKNGQTAQFEMQALSEGNALSLNVSAALGIRRAITETANADFYVSGNQSMIPVAEGPIERRFSAFGFFLAVTNNF